MTLNPFETSSPPVPDPSRRQTDRPWTWVDTPELLEELVRHVTAQPLAGVDTESDSFHHYREQVCLIQISTPEVDAIIDPLVLTDLSSLRPLFSDPAREWVMNGADYDIVCLKRDFGIHFGRMFDTVVAAQLLGYPATGLAAMLERHFGLKVSKSFQRDEWFRRPLTPEQVSYALTDTRFLIPLRAILRAELQEAGRLAWAEEEFLLLARREWTREPFQPDDFWRIRGARDLGRREQLVLRELAVMRDARAQEVNRPPFKVMSDAVLLALARLQPASLSALRRVRGISPLMARRMGGPLLEAVRRGMEAEETSLSPPRSGERRRFDPSASRRLDALKEWRRLRSAELHLDPGVLAPLSSLQIVSRANPKTIDEMLALPELTRWRIHEFGAEWIATMTKG
jgi:ribonuclease D